MSNLLYRCQIKKTSTNGVDGTKPENGYINKEPTDVLLRLYGPAYSETEIQLEIFKKLANEQLGPKLYSQFDDGRLEEYLPSNALTWDQMTSLDTSAVIAKKIACIHELNLSHCLQQDRNWLMDQFLENYDYVAALQKEQPLFENLPDSTRKIAMELIHEIDFHSQIEYMKQILDKLKGKLVFSHNDLHQNNILMLHETGVVSGERPNGMKPTKVNKRYVNESNSEASQHDDPIVLIDFEFCSYNYRAFDMANHLSEWCFDYSGDDYPNFKLYKERFPTEDRQREFLKHYANQLVTSAKNNPDKNDSTHENDVNYLIDSLFEEMQPLFMASSLLWSLWAIKSACTSNIKFGYWEMAKGKWDIYMMCKSRYDCLKANL